ncbi:MAG: SRPBCC family protein [Demequina sp.]|nr:SRPBCC family protein [Demequina sp.]
MEWIDYSVDAEALVPAPIDFVWQCIADPANMPQTRPGVLIAVTASGEVGTAQHAFFVEVKHPHTGLHHLYKTRVLKAEPPSTWATLTETAGYSAREYWMTSTGELPGTTRIVAHAMFREVVPKDKERRLGTYRKERAAHQQEHADQDIAYFATAVARLHEAATS